MKKLILIAVTIVITLTLTIAQSFDENETDGIYCPSLTRYLKLGYRDSNTGGEVSELQQFLVDYYDLESDQLLATGIFGKVTKGYLMNFQRDNNLIITGLLGKPTRDKIKKVCTITQPGLQPACTPLATQTRTTTACPVGQTGVITETLGSVCSQGATSPTNTWTITGNTCTGTITNTSCSLNGKTILHGESVLAYQSSVVPFGSTCTSENRTCSNGILSKSFEYSSCSVSSQTCTPLATQTRTTTACPVGQTGVITETLGSVCSQGATSPTNTWTITGNTCKYPTNLTPTTASSYSNLGELSHNACSPELAKTKDGAGTLLHLGYRQDPTEKYFSMINKIRYASSCVVFDFEPSVPTAITVTYRASSTPRGDGCYSDGCSGVFCGTGGEPEIYISAQTSKDASDSWKYIGKGPRQTMFTDYKFDLSGTDTVRSVLVCRNAGAQEREDVEIDMISITPSSSNPTTLILPPPNPYLLALRQFFESSKSEIQAQTNSVYSSQQVAYPITSTYSLMSSWILDHDAISRSLVEKNINQTLANDFTPDGLPIGKRYTTLSRDYIAREMNALYHAYLIFNNPAYLKKVDDVADKMLALLPRGSITYKNKTYNLFYGEYTISAPHTPLPEDEHISPNQNAELGLLFTQLYHNRNSKHFQNSTVATIARDELNAALSVQNTDGSLPLLAGSPYNDTNYASYAIALVALANVYWKDPAYTTGITKAGAWLATYNSEGNYARHYGNNIVETNEYASEMWYRLAPFYSINTNITPYLQKYYNTWLPTGEIRYISNLVFAKFSNIPFNYFLLK